MPAETSITFGATMREYLRAAEERNAAALDTVAERVLEVVRTDGRIHVAGTGHSSALVLEAFYRAG
ncbi:MAG: SIS domain-containing protein, partial [Actinomycetota bacterium]